MTLTDGIPLWVAMPSFVALFLAGSWAILLAVRPWVRRASVDHEEGDRVLGCAMSSYGLFYGILLALIAVAVYENFERVDGVVLQEVASLGSLYRGASAYPEPLASELQHHLRQYTMSVIASDWPLQQQGIIPAEGDPKVDHIQAALLSFEPTTVGQQTLHNQVLGEFFDFLDARRERLDETKLALPGVMWVVVGIGAVINAVMLSLVEVRRLRVHLVLSGIIAVFVAMLIFVIASMDHPYSGLVSISPEAFQALLDELMT